MGKLKSLYVLENYDYIRGEQYVRREDGVRVVYSNNGSVCSYPDGTKITTNFNEILLPNDFEEGIMLFIYMEIYLCFFKKKIIRKYIFRFTVQRKKGIQPRDGIGYHEHSHC